MHFVPSQIVQTKLTNEQFSPQVFRQLFKSITADNGSEFSDCSTIERSASDANKRFDLYFAHPYRACERGTNENHNGIIRRFLPEGIDFRLVDRTSVADIQQWMNTYPRKLFNGDSPLMELQKYFGDSFFLPSW